MRKAIGLAVVVLAVAPVGAAAKDLAATALNIIPSGQYGGLPVPPGADQQAQMYDGLTPLFDNVQSGDLTTYFKSEAFNSIGTDGPAKTEKVPRKGVTITRDKYNVPHVKSKDYDGGIWAAGWLLAEDRALLLEQARFNSRVAAIGVPGLQALTLIAGLKTFKPSKQTEKELAKQTDVLKKAGKDGKAVLHDFDVFVQGINDRYKKAKVKAPKWTRSDVYALDALKGQFVGQGGGSEARRTQFYSAL